MIENKILSSLKNEQVKYWTSLKQMKNIKKFKQFIIETNHLVDIALKKGIVKTLIGSKSELEKYSFQNKIEVSQSIIEKISNVKTSQSIFAICDLITEVFDPQIEKILMIDDIQDPGNLGTLFRTAKAFGFNQIVMSPNTVSVYNDKLLRSTQGIIFALNFCYRDIELTINQLIASGFQILSTFLDEQSINYLEFTPNKKFCLLLGNEGNGLSDELRKLTDINVTIKTNDVESLNVAIAGAILMARFN
ncbi:RNA methyltransferase [Spiroplasma endosymbiont of Labia minor]|uniref:TrmH family RNA methyltransferase n=1 Tax=Spiroplasma endosymbiont of Labia minor TaxID=3066305 RepID=UPI0030CFA904